MLILQTSQLHTTRTKLAHKFTSPTRHQIPEQVKAIQFLQQQQSAFGERSRKEVDLFMFHYEKMIHNLPSEEIVSLDTQKREQCESAIISLK